MFLLLGSKETARRVDGGRTEVRACTSCGAVARFDEVEVIATLRVYLMDVVNYRNARVLQCVACNARFAFDGSAASLTDQLASGLGRASAAVRATSRRLANELADRTDHYFVDSAKHERTSSGAAGDLSEDDLRALAELAATRKR